MSNSSTETLSIQLNNCIRRIACKASLVELVNAQGCSVKRIRRSRHWLLQGEVEQLCALSAELKQTPMLWVSQAIDKALPKPIFDLAALLAANPSMTANQLMVKTGCSATEARAAIDRAEGFI